MIFRLHSTPEIDVPFLILHLIELYSINPQRAVSIFQQGFKGLPESVIVDILEQKIAYEITNSVVIVNTKVKI